MKRRHAFGASLLVAAAAAGLVSQLGLGGSDKVKIGNGSIAALARTDRATDRLPQTVLSYPFAARNFASPNGEGARLLQTRGSLRLYAVPGKESLLCLIEIDTEAATAGGACADRSILLTGAIYMADRQEDGSRLVVGLVADGHSYAEANGRRARIENNSFVLAGVAGSELTIGSPTAAQTVDLGG